LRNNEELQEIWKKLKMNIIIALSSLEIANFKSANIAIQRIFEEDLKKLRVFLFANSDNLLDLKTQNSWVSKYFLSLTIGIFMTLMIACLVYKSPKLQSKKFV